MSLLTRKRLENALLYTRQELSIKKNIWLTASILCENQLQNVVRAWEYKWEQFFLLLSYKSFIINPLYIQWGHEGINTPNFLMKKYAYFCYAPKTKIRRKVLIYRGFSLFCNSFQRRGRVLNLFSLFPYISAY